MIILLRWAIDVGSAYRPRVISPGYCNVRAIGFSASEFRVEEQSWRFGISFGYDPDASEWKSEAGAVSSSLVEPSDPIRGRARR
jgi:hypothetical protein